MFVITDEEASYINVSTQFLNQYLHFDQFIQEHSTFNVVSKNDGFFLSLDDKDQDIEVFSSEIDDQKSQFLKKQVQLQKRIKMSDSSSEEKTFFRLPITPLKSVTR